MTHEDDETLPNDPDTLGETQGDAPDSAAPTIPARSEPREKQPVPEAPRKLAGYRLIRVLGRGGMGEVWEAEQDRPRRKVAIKLVRGDLMSPAMRRRFDIEAEALGRLNHEGIAKVFEAGLDPSTSQPYYAMEYVEGQTLGRYIAESNPSIEKRLRLIIALCRAVQHAHQKGVIHRDLKPGNILITPAGKPKILDFGLARLAGDGDEASLVTRETQAGQVLGTLAYMSPEQAGGKTDAIDSLTDIYALGVITYQLLAGQMPLNLNNLSLPVAVRRIVEDEPSRLSSIDRGLRGDLDTIVAKAMAKDRSIRYASAEALAEDIRRYLESEPIAARRPSTWYNARKFARRNKAIVAGVAASFMILLAGAATSTVFAIRASEQATAATIQAERAIKAEHDAIAQRDEANRQKEEAERQEAIALETNDFLVGIFHEADPAVAQGREITAVELVTRGAAGLSDRFSDQALVKASLQNTLALVFMELGRSAEAEPLLRSALEVRQKMLGAEHPDTLVSINNLATVLEDLGQASQTEPMHRRTLEIRERDLGPDHLDTLLTANNLASALRQLGRAGEAEPLFRRVVAGYEAQLGPDDPRTLAAVGSLADVLDAQGRSADAEPLFRRSMEGHERVFGANHPYTFMAINNMAYVQQSLGRFDVAERLYRKALEGRQRVLGADHPETMSTVNNLGAVLYETGRYAEAEVQFRRVLETRERVLGADHPDTLASVGSVSVALMSHGKYAEAEPLLRRSLAGNERLLGADHPQTLNTMGNMAGLLNGLGRTEEAEQMYRRVLSGRERVLGKNHIETLLSVYGLAVLVDRQGRTAEAYPLLRRALDSAASDPSLGPDHPRTQRFAKACAKCLDKLDRSDEAAAVRKQFRIE